jgi:ABC-type thiamine transport system substrate-binding protein
VLSYTTSPAYHIIAEKKDNYAAANLLKDTTCRLKSLRVPPPASSRNWQKSS